MSVSQVSGAVPHAQAHSGSEVYYVRSGDSMSAIAQRFGVPLSALEAANRHISNPNVIFPGEKIAIPGGHGGGPAPASEAGAASAGKGSPAAHFSMSEKGIRMLEGFEGLRLTAYQDSGGVWTIGYGHTGGVHAGQRISQAQAEQYLKHDLGWAQDAVRRNVHVPLNQNQFDALVSLTYNLGPNGYPGLLGDLNHGNYAAAQNDFHDYVHAGGQVLQGLVNRRNKEAALFGSKAPGGSPAPAPAPAPAPGHAPAPSTHDYKVHAGDTLTGIAARNHVSLAALEKANGQIKNPNRIYVGETVHIPGKKSAAAPATKSHDVTVRAGDTLTAIAQRNHVSLAALEKANPQIRDPNRINIGQRVHVPGSGGSSKPAPAPAPSKSKTHDYRVRSGDTLSGIAANQGVSLSALERANPQIHNPNRISIGQIIHVPGAGQVGGSGSTGSTGPIKGTNAAAKASKYLGRYESDLQRNGVTLNCPTSESCANFVTAMLKQSGRLPGGFSYVDRVNVHAMTTTLQNHGWHKVSLANAKPGDVWVCDGAHGESHTEIVASNDGHGHVKLIGSNNHPVNSNQQINYDSYSASIGGSYILAPP